MTFTGREWKYHYDFIRVVSDGQELRVGLHAYPVRARLSGRLDIALRHACRPLRALPPGRSCTSSPFPSS